MEVYALEKESQVIALEKELEALYREKEGALSNNEGLHSEIKSLSEMLNDSHSKVNELQQELLALVSWSSSCSFFYFHRTNRCCKFVCKIAYFSVVLCIQRNRLDESKVEQQKTENCIKMLAEEKEELALVV